jgi:hypothetical protein
MKKVNLSDQKGDILYCSVFDIAVSDAWSLMAWSVI